MICAILFGRFNVFICLWHKLYANLVAAKKWKTLLLKIIISNNYSQKESG